MTRLSALLAALTLATTPALAIPPVNPFHQRLLRMDDATRNGVMRRAITDNGERCGRLERSAYTRRYGNLEMWTARCIPGGEYGVYVGPDGSAQIRACDTLRQLRLPACAKLPPPTPTKQRK